jgi:lipopolysaccharide export system permease protein
MILQKYIAKNIILHFLVILCILTVVFLMITYFYFVKEAAAAKLNYHDITRILITEIPVLLQPILPLSLFLAILLVLRKMHATNEIIAMNTVGMSEYNLFMSVIIICILLVSLSCYVQLYISPHTNRMRNYLLEKSLTNVTFDKIFQKQFNELTPENMIYLEEKINKFKVNGIFYSHTTPKSNSQFACDIITAQSMEEKILPDDSKFIIFRNGTHYLLDRNTSEATIIQFEKFGIRIATNQHYRIADWPGCMETTTLYTLSKRNNYAAAELQWRMSIPISIINLTFFAFAYNKRRISGRSRKLMTMIYPLLIYLIYVNLLLLSIGLIKNEVLDKKIGLWWIHTIMFFYCLIGVRWNV